MTRRKQEKSLEALEEQASRALAEEEEEEVRLDELIEVMADRESLRADMRPLEVRGSREFLCASCHLVMPRSCLGDEDRLLCRDCVREAAGRPARDAGGRVHHRTVERICPACGRTLMIPDREDAACGFFCPGCGVHLRQRAGHLHMEWDHAYHPELGPHPHVEHDHAPHEDQETEQVPPRPGPSALPA